MLDAMALLQAWAHGGSYMSVSMPTRAVTGPGTRHASPKIEESFMLAALVANDRIENKR